MNARTTGRAVLMFLTACALTIGIRASESVASPTHQWVVLNTYIVEVDGEPSETTRLFNTHGKAWILLFDPSIGLSVVVDPQSRAFRRADTAQIAENEDGVTMPDTALSGDPMPFTIDGEAVILFSEGRRIAISRKPPLIGQTTVEEIFEHSPVYRRGMERYSPADGDVGYLRSIDLPLRVEVFFGSWCPHCKDLVPKFLKCIEIASNPNISLDLTGVPAPPFLDYPPAKERGIRGVPTFILYTGEREIGRFSGVPDGSTIEHEVVKMVAAYRAASS